MQIDCMGKGVSLELIETLVLASTVGEESIELVNLGETSMFTLMKDIYKGLIEPKETSMVKSTLVEKGKEIQIGQNTHTIRKVSKGQHTENTYIITVE